MNPSLEEPLFLPTPFFLVRAPTLPIEDFHRWSHDLNLKERLFSLFQTNTGFRQAILIASKELYTAMLKVEEKDAKQQEQLKSSLLRYFLRMSSRSTPFGLFSFVAFGEWGEKACGVFDHATLQKRARPDMEWLTKVIDAIVENTVNFPFLPFMTNPLLTHTSGRTFLNYVRKKTNDGERKTISIRSTILTQLIFKLAEFPITIDELEKRISEEFPSIDLLKTRGVINQLIEQQLLISSLHPSLITDSTFDDFIRKLSQLGTNIEELPPLQDIQTMINIYNTTKFDEGETLLLELYQSMAKMTSAPNYLQVDLGATEHPCVVPIQLQKNLSEACETVWKLSTLVNQDNDYLSEYHGKFLEKYGTSRRIPLLEVLDESGLGTPEEYLNSNVQKAPTIKQTNQWHKWLKTQWTLCLHERRHEIVLTDETVQHFVGKEIDKKKPPLSFDLLCNIIAESPDKLSLGDYQINLISMSPQAGNFFGRFLDLLGPTAKNAVKELYSKEASIDPACQFVETSYFPLSARTANVATLPNLRSHQLDLADRRKSSVQITDIYVGTTNKGFYLTDREGTKEWIFRAGNMLTLEMCPIPIRFLRDVSLQRHGICRHHLWGDLSQASFLPRLSYKRIILSAAQWNIDLIQLDANEKTSLGQLEEKFVNWMNRWSIPRYFYLSEGDNQILIDRTCGSHIREVVQKIKKNHQGKLIEKIDQTTESNWLSSTLGTHLNEVVVPFTLNPKNSFFGSQTLMPKVSSLQRIERHKGIGSDWLYMKIYLSKENHDRFILNNLSGLTEHLAEQKAIHQWFFIRYNDTHEGSHLRIRFHAEPEKILSILIPTIHEWSKAMFEDRFIRKIEFCTYDREIERYGGEKLIEAVENLFCCDTLTTIDLIKIVNRKDKKIPNYVVAAISLVDFVKQFSSVFDEPIESLISLIEDQSELKGIREWKKVLFESHKKIFGQREEKGNDDEWPFFQQAFQKRANQLVQVARLINEGDANHDLTLAKESIYHSLVHMHCNRLVGIDINLENKARLYANYVLSAHQKQFIQVFHNGSDMIATSTM